MIMNYYALNQRIVFLQRLVYRLLNSEAYQILEKNLLDFFQKEPKKCGFVTKSAWVQPVQSIKMWEFIFLLKYDEENSR